MNNATGPHYNIPVCQYSLHCCQQSLPHLNNSMYSSPVTNALFSLQPLAHSVLQCLIIGLLVLSQALFQSTKQVEIWWCGSTVHPIFLWSQQCTHLSVAIHCYGGETLETFCYATDLTNDSKAADFFMFQSAVSVCCCLCRQEIHKNNSFLRGLGRHSG